MKKHSKLFKSKVKKVIPQGDVAARMRAMRARGVDIAVPEYKISARRKVCEFDFPLFCQTYLESMFPLPDSEDQVESKGRIQHAVLKGGRQSEAAPRGDGKTQRAKAGSLWASLMGHWRFTVPMAATGDKAKQLLGEIIQEIADNEKLAEDWPDICKPIREAFGKPQRARHITVNGNPCRMVVTNKVLVFPTTGLCKGASKDCGGSVMMSAGILGAIRGLRYTTATGETIRPDGVLMDDIQTRASAKSPMARQKILKTIRGDVMRMAGPNKECSALAMVTVIEKGDAADQLLSHKLSPEWRGVRKKMVIEWGNRKDLESEYFSRRRAGLLEGDGGASANEFYVANQAAIEDGSKCGWIHRFRKEQGEVSAYHCALNTLCDDGEEAFFAECQNEPIEQKILAVKLTVEDIIQRVNMLPMGEVPLETQYVTGFIDANDHALAWMMCAWWNKGGLTGSIIGYGEWGRNGNGEVGNINRLDKIWDEAKPAQEGKLLAFWNALTALEEWLFGARWMRGGQAVIPSIVLADVGYTLNKGDETLYRWLGQMAKTGHGNLGYSRGFPASKFRAEAKAEGARFDTLEASVSEWWRFDKYKAVENVYGMPHDADYHRRQMQLALMLPVGSPGSIVINGTSKTQHVILAQQIASEQLTEYQPADQSTISGFYQFNKVVGIRQEMADCLRGCRLGALFKLRNSLGVDVTIVPPAPIVAMQQAIPAPIQQQVINRTTTRPAEPQFIQGWGPRDGRR